MPLPPRLTPMKPAPRRRLLRSLSILCAVAANLAIPLIGQEEPLTPEKYEREELGVNIYTAPSIERIFQQLDALRPLQFEQLQREISKDSSARRVLKGP